VQPGRAALFIIRLKIMNDSGQSRLGWAVEQLRTGLFDGAPCNLPGVAALKWGMGGCSWWARPPVASFFRQERKHAE